MHTHYSYLNYPFKFEHFGHKHLEGQKFCAASHKGQKKFLVPLAPKLIVPQGVLGRGRGGRGHV